MNAALLDALDRAVTSVDAAAAEGWDTAGDGWEARQLARLRSDLLAFKVVAERGERLPRNTVTRLLRWVADWIPNLDHPLLHAVYVVQQAADPD